MDTSKYLTFTADLSFNTHEKQNCLNSSKLIFRQISGKFHSDRLLSHIPDSKKKKSDKMGDSHIIYKETKREWMGCVFTLLGTINGFIYTPHACAGGKQAAFHIYIGRVPFDQYFWKFRYKIEWNRKSLETRFENFGQPLEVLFFRQF